MKYLLSIFILVLATSCSHDPESIHYGSDNCSFCKMTIMEEKFAAECVSTKGKVFKFDDIHCLTTFLHNGGVWSNEIAGIYISDFAKKGQWVNTDKAFFLHSEGLKSPMGGNYAAFSTEADREAAAGQFAGEKLTWKEVFVSK